MVRDGDTMPLTESDLCYWNHTGKLYNNDSANCLWYQPGKDCTRCTHYMPRFVGYLSGCPNAKELDAINSRHNKVKS